MASDEQMINILLLDDLWRVQCQAFFIWD